MKSDVISWEVIPYAEIIYRFETIKMMIILFK